MNHLIIMADEFAPGALGCAGHTHVQTPHLDRLAAGGARFTNAYTPSPMCVPARAALQTGLHVHKVRCWGSAEPYRGQPRGWGHHLRQQGVSVASVGKLHFGSSEQDNGFDPELLPLHVVDGEGWVPGLLRDDPPPFDASTFAGNIGPGGSSYSEYDERICARARRWLTEAPEDPWVLFVSFVSPHYPLRCPQPFYDLYDPATVDMPFGYEADVRPNHPVVRGIMEASSYDRHFDEERIRIARASYYGLCSYIDDLVGQLLSTLEQQGLTDSTRVVFTADHGEMLGNHGAWTKMLMYEDSVGVPLLLAGPDIDRGRVSEVPVTLLDIVPMIYEDHGLSDECANCDGTSLTELTYADGSGRDILSQYHDGWSRTGFFMIRWDRWKFVHYEGYAPQLFDLVTDPGEINDIAADPSFTDVLTEGQQRLRAYLDPGEVNARAFADQARLIESFGGRAGILEKMALYFDYTPLSNEATAE